MSRLCFVLLCALSSCTYQEHFGPGPSTVYDFDRMASGAVPSGWNAAETAGKGTPARWVTEDGTLRVASTMNAGGTFNLMFAPGEFGPDLIFGARLRADGGKEDRGGGIMWRALGPSDYYVARWNPLEGNVRAYRVVNGERTQLASADCGVDPEGWHLLRVEAIGPRTTVSLDNDELLVFEDGTFGGPGAIGVWTKADAATSFDDLAVAPAR